MLLTSVCEMLTYGAGTTPRWILSLFYWPWKLHIRVMAARNVLPLRLDPSGGKNAEIWHKKQSQRERERERGVGGGGGKRK